MKGYEWYKEGDISLDFFIRKAFDKTQKYMQYYGGLLNEGKIDRITSYNVCYTKLLRTSWSFIKS